MNKHEFIASLILLEWVHYSQEIDRLYDNTNFANSVFILENGKLININNNDAVFTNFDKAFDYIIKELQ